MPCNASASKSTFGDNPPRFKSTHPTVYRPGRLKREVDIDLKHPRDSEVVSSEAFGRYVAEIWHDLRREASRGIRDDESRVLRAGAKR